MKNYFIVLGFLLAGISAREIELESFKPSPATDKSIFDFGTLRLAKIKRNEFVISGTFHVRANIGNEATLAFEILSTSGDVLYKMEKLFCEFLSSETKVLPDLRKVSNLPSSKTCPLPKGKYTIKHYKVDETRFQFLSPGEYVGKMKLSRDAKLLAEASVQATLFL